ncbi:hypothetical protein [Helicobacter sp. MIT 99-5507]|uniref:hypothetical protein n=1 Tax=Helicobacter sp. MIT 99-5507 TaxID=152489 RepID=UPI000E1F2F15|nr:hypothetical protein [Helicobacter sp. MIT 99-5507]RDU58632.1 hypothetical protein CQA42_02300 [Helicobacter sp. MIT 99-5507]
MNSQNESISNNKRRECLKNSAKLGIASFGVLGLAHSLFTAGSNTASNLANAVPFTTLNNGVKCLWWVLIPLT